ncbi:MAG: DUF4435 domain-containing protein [Paludibacteraceae bacterium]|nr:DUF4435 domain-containing protein [Paludibacteraceae bacterium]
MNSIQASLLKNPQSVAADMANNIRRLIATNKKVVFVEGVIDEKIYSKFLNLDNVFVYKLYGYPNILIGVKEINRLKATYKDRYFAIKDADFDRILGKGYEPENILLTDYHDIEMFLLCEEEVYSVFEKEFNIQFASGIENAIEEIKVLSFLKLYNCIKELGYSFKKKCTVRKLYKKGDISLYNCLLALQSDKRNCDCKSLEEGEIFSFIEEFKEVAKEQLTNGHDLMQIVVIKLNELNYKINDDCTLLSDKLIDNYTLDKFKKTKLYLKIVEIEKKTQCKILLS